MPEKPPFSVRLFVRFAILSSRNSIGSIIVLVLNLFRSASDGRGCVNDSKYVVCLSRSEIYLLFGWWENFGAIGLCWLHWESVLIFGRKFFNFCLWLCDWTVVIFHLMQQLDSMLRLFSITTSSSKSGILVCQWISLQCVTLNAKKSHENSVAKR